ncbi:MAG TPA: hypothetical protein VKU79_00520, partial [Thermoplasmataceae archaeon]|nr:hypothetical protein [Thermoplasmataceae archaeon]
PETESRNGGIRFIKNKGVSVLDFVYPPQSTHSFSCLENSRDTLNFFVRRLVPLRGHIYNAGL